MSHTEERQTNYELRASMPAAWMQAPDIPFKPRDPARYRPNIGMIACGGITESHCRAYRSAGYNVVALCDLIEDRARLRQEVFYPDAQVTTDYADLLARADIDVVDIATHPEERAQIIEDALSAGKHVLSQKPFVLDLNVGRRLADLADRKGVRLAVNQNGRWAPHLSYMRVAVKEGLIGDLIAIHMSIHWDHTWTVGTRFEEIDDLVLYDFGIHWFDYVRHLLGQRGWTRVIATRARAIGQQARPPMLAQCLIETDGAQVSLTFDAHVKHGSLDQTIIAGTRGTLFSTGPDLSHQQVTLITPNGVSSPYLEGEWFPIGFHGSMSELLCAIEEDREPINSARDNLQSLDLCFAAIHSAHTGRPAAPGAVARLPGT